VALGWVLPGVREVRGQAGPYGAAWRRANIRALMSSGPLWVVLGDSLSQGLGASAYDRGWVGQLRDRLARDGHPFRIVNLSVSGARIHEVLRDQVPALEALTTTPALVTLLVGSNDLFRGGDRTALAETYAALLRRLPARSVVATLPTPTRTARLLNDTTETVARQHDFVVADTRDQRTTSWRDKLSADHFHPNERGYASIADVFEDAVRKRLS
jgi:lysophospholipase L1-like esterase